MRSVDDSLALTGVQLKRSRRREARHPPPICIQWVTQCTRRLETHGFFACRSSLRGEERSGTRSASNATSGGYRRAQSNPARDASDGRGITEKSQISSRHAIVIRMAKLQIHREMCPPKQTISS
ncbi:hypothetical protein EVAR_6472_1 [Eumeta japonica]|uniref:Uncharacterized protein n=1 Tax=Eumeta variegata TaxID=151549 RepID=A0A4C1ST54_EUMVA|nr:hypothetical protein EVAR_6472_1 [Eumeta japonica]